MARRNNSKKIVAVIAVAALALGAVLGTMAFFTDEDSATNTFTVGQIEITLTETVPADNTAKMVPGTDIDKNPVLTVKADSLASWVFVKIDESSNFDDFMTYAVAAGWTQGDGTSIPANVYYRQQAATSADVTLGVLANDQVHVKDTVTMAMLNELTSSTYPTLSFTGYACQLAKGSGETMTAAEAWGQVSA